MKDRIESAIRETIRLHEELGEQATLVAEIGERLAGVLAAGGRIYVMGNGGSAADSQHLACELVGRFLMDGRRALPCQAFTTDTSVLTAVGNDFGMDEVFLRQVEAFVEAGDAVIGISTSGGSNNVNVAIDRARELGAATVGLCGGDGGDLARKCDISLTVAADTSPRVQEVHATLIHILCDLIESRLAGQTD
jgi:D-sedoheptulose 7-phosphate isomerase